MVARLSGTNIVQNAFHQTNDIVDGGGVELIVEFSVAHTIVQSFVVQQV